MTILLPENSPSTLDAVIAPDVHAEILQRVARVERDEGVRILLAVESGSRAWGFHSPNSDYEPRPCLS